MEYLSHSERETEEIGAELARNLRPGSVLAFRGGLGMGKTAFIRGLARGLGYPGRVTSPTFTIVNEYEGGRLPLFHFDLYRLGGAGELWDLGWDEYQERGGICAAEWSERADALFPDGTIVVTLERGPDGDSSRRITISGLDSPLCRLTATSPPKGGRQEPLHRSRRVADSVAVTEAEGVTVTEADESETKGGASA